MGNSLLTLGVIELRRNLEQLLHGGLLDVAVAAHWAQRASARSFLLRDRWLFDFESLRETGFLDHRSVLRSFTEHNPSCVISVFVCSPCGRGDWLRIVGDLGFSGFRESAWKWLGLCGAPWGKTLECRQGAASQSRGELMGHD